MEDVGILVGLVAARGDKITGKTDYIRPPEEGLRNGAVDVIKADDRRGVKVREMEKLDRWSSAPRQWHGNMAGLQPFRLDEMGVTRGAGPGKENAAEKAAALDAARAAKDFATADAIRADLQAAGWTVETTKDGTKVRR